MNLYSAIVGSQPDGSESVHFGSGKIDFVRFYSALLGWTRLWSALFGSARLPSGFGFLIEGRGDLELIFSPTFGWAWRV